MMLAALLVILASAPVPSHHAKAAAPAHKHSAAALDRAMSSAPSTAAEWSTLGRAFYDARRYRDAAASFQRVMQLDKSAAAGAAFNVARSYARLENRKQALRWLDHARQLGFTDDVAIRRERVFDRYRDAIAETISVSARSMKSPPPCSLIRNTRQCESSSSLLPFHPSSRAD